MRLVFGQFKEATWSIIVVFLFIQAVLSTLQNYVFLKNEFCLDIYRAIIQNSAGLVQPTLVFNILSIIVVITVLFGFIGKLKPGDVGIDLAKIKQASLIIFAFWLFTNVLFAISSWVLDGTVNWNSDWTDKGVLVVFGIAMGQIIGNALYEEVAFRGFLLPQFYLKFGGDRKSNTRHKLVLAIVASQLYFALIHIPHRLTNNVTGFDLVIELIMTLIIGVLFAVYYIRTENLLLVVGLHSLLNYPTALVSTPPDDQIIPGILMILLLLFWRKIVPSAGRLSPRNET